MDCNRDKALRAKTIAEGKLESNDFAGAKKFALKSQSLYPGLDGLSQMLTTIDVYISAENKIGGEVDWYGVLGVSPTADDETVLKQYRKLALLLHPEKNQSVGADGAFKLICEAWSLLSDKSKRLAYNTRRCPKGFQLLFHLYFHEQMVTIVIWIGQLQLQRRRRLMLLCPPHQLFVHARELIPFGLFVIFARCIMSILKYILTKLFFVPTVIRLFMLQRQLRPSIIPSHQIWLHSISIRSRAIMLLLAICLIRE